ncbi:hypothetical protein KY306_02665 [Candidatus Woesearchaeota archaeon]|nr:hypothetical protein [Candidatus Woesearchaeota archaeon]
MVTFLDIGLLNYFSIIFPALLIFAIVFAILTMTKILGGNKIIDALVAVSLGFLALLSEDVVGVINYMAPWFVLVFVFVILLVLIYRTLGATEKDVGDFIRTDRPVKWAIFSIGIIIFLAALGNVVGEKIGPYLGEGSNVTTEEIQAGVATGSWSQNVGATLFHPKILGMLLIILIAVFTIALLGMEPVK